MSSSNVDEQHALSKNSAGDAAIQLEQTPSTEKKIFSQADTFCLQTKIFEAIEELKMRRELHAEAEEKTQQLLQENLNLQKKIDAEKKRNLIQAEEHNTQMSEIKKKFSDNLISIKEDKEKHVLLAETAEKEVLKLRDEIRNMLLNKYSLEKRVQELERAIDFQDSSRTSHHSQLADLELKCKQINSQRAVIEELFDQFKQNVESASEFNRKLEYVSKHRQCQIDELELIVKEQRQELVEVRAKLEARPSPGTEMSRMKKQEDTIHKELQAKDKLCEQLLKHVEEIRNDHKKTQSSLSDAHELIDHYVRSKELSSVQEVKYQHLLNDHEVLKDSWEEKNKLCLSLKESITNKEKEWLQREEELSKSLMVYQSKCDDLTKSSGKLEEIKDYYSRMYEESRLSCQVLQESITENSNLSKRMNVSQTTQTEYKHDELLPTLTDATNSNNAESHPHLKDSNIYDDTSTIKNNENKGSSEIMHLYNMDKDVPNLIDRIQSTSPELVSYYVTANHGITNDDTNIEQVSDKNRTKENIQYLCDECDENVSKEQDNQSTWPTNNERNLTTTDLSLERASAELPVTSKTEELPLSLELCLEPDTSGNSGRCRPKTRFDLKEISENASTDCDKQGHTQTHPDKFQDNDYVLSHKCEIKTDNLDVSNTNECKPHYVVATTSCVHQDQVTMSASESPLNEHKHLKEIDVVNQCTDNTFVKNVQSNSLTKSNIPAIGNFRPMEIDSGSLNTDLVAICQTARSDLNLISQQWEAEKKSHKISKDSQGQSFQTSEPHLKRFSNHPINISQNKKARFQTNDKSCPSDSNMRNDSSTAISSDFKSQVADTCSQTQLFSDDDEQEELNNREYIANQISRLA